ncbi:hypothetical protein ZOSMA_70G00470 [Zostera marina]|uniref:Uncharacterized protein n=1 Tax=Zostera marina TaxID=29655 RepID=A0A0K9NQZ5_ZOSMR|nr:hypothetical protein ZOSMA_70G00470 [Zostera marina]
MDCRRRRRIVSLVCAMTSLMMMCVHVWVCHFHSSSSTAAALSIPVIPEESQRRSSFKPTSRFLLGIGTTSPFSATNSVGSRSNFVDSKRKVPSCADPLHNR